MSKVLAVCAAVALCVASATAAQAQGGPNKKNLVNFNPNMKNNVLPVKNGFQQPPGPKQGLGNVGKLPGNGGVPGLNGPVFNGTYVTNSLNGNNNQLVVDKGGPGSLVNISVVVGSGNGNSNVIHTGGGNGLVNVDVIVNSANGNNNTVKTH